MQRLSRRPFLAVLALALPALSLSARADEAPFAPVPADQVVEADLLFLRRPVIVFADSPYDPAFIRQMELLARSYAALAARDLPGGTGPNALKAQLAAARATLG